MNLLVGENLINNFKNAQNTINNFSDLNINEKYAKGQIRIITEQPINIGKSIKLPYNFLVL